MVGKAIARMGQVVALGALAAGGYALFVRPWHLRWGATADEAGRALPGDAWVPRPKVASTRAITIEAPPADVWPWLIQMGTGRAGWYSYTWLENQLPASAVGAGITNAERIIPELQQLKVGDSIPLSPTMGFTVAEIDPPRLLALRVSMTLTGMPRTPEAEEAGGSFEGSWVFVLEAVDHVRTRLIERVRADYQPASSIAPLAYGFMEPAFFLMERKMLRGIKQRAEREEGSAHAREAAEAMFPSTSGRAP